MEKVKQAGHAQEGGKRKLILALVSPSSCEQAKPCLTVAAFVLINVSIAVRYKSAFLRLGVSGVTYRNVTFSHQYMSGRPAP
ncbi:Uncharacterized protein DAT39_020382 [Clarias magur]|uniref:Uncharacterized protein n=1 Tax=Clarias magur TaxID=1594786 RepID=A0A8J4U335_CLAMG|nr:Uncharacterized protein DAT39_020382 [Clarias magur]